MIVGVDCHVLSGKYQGSRTYLLNLYRSVLSLDRKNQYLFFGHWDGHELFGHADQHVEFLSQSRWKRLTYQTEPLIKKYRVDLYHSTFISPLYLSCKKLLTVHDVLYETHPHFFRKSFVIRNQMLVRHSAKKATQIHTISEYSRHTIAEIYNVPVERIKVVPCGIDLTRYMPGDRNTAAERVAAAYSVADYILTVGRIEPRKNHLGLLRAYSKLKQELPSVGPLVIVGQRDFGYVKFYQTIHELKLHGSVIILEDIDDDLLPDIYRASRLFVYPSFAEGFGIPPLEAMASGVPVIVSNSTAFPEVVGNAGILIDPEITEHLSEAMYRVLTDHGLACELAQKGRKQAEKWSWDNAARAYIDALQEL